ncbi:ATP-grasp fold amidoligase family protein [Falsiroseomonas sp.]|uniref:ATP-grasp fold amidoligase family protein n=1 Tax=Falsiroseomonas sp. TaxID=2870721 RepID=UPI003561D203
MPEALLRLARPALRLLRRLPLVGPPLVRATLLRRQHRATGERAQLDPPVTFNDHILHRMLYDRDPRLKVINDKLAVRQVIAGLAGPAFVVPLLGVWDDPERIDWERLPERFVLKSNHASGRFALVRNPAERDPAALAARARAWLSSDYFDESLEWGYRGLPRRLLAEPLLVGPDGGPPAELQVLTFGGRAHYYRIQTGQKGMGGRTDTWYDPSGRRLEIRIGLRPSGVTATREEAETAMAAAERVSAGFAHLRVDFYLTGCGPRIGELTPYHRAGMTRWAQREWDERLGALWTAATARGPALAR